MSNILVLEDSEDNFILAKYALSPTHNLTWARSVAHAKTLYNDSTDLILVDIGLPDGDGFEFCDWVRSTKGNWNIPIIFISGQVAVESRIAGYMVGGDDYVCKPFNIIELKARVDARLRRNKTSKPLVTEVGPLTIDLRAQRVQTKLNGKLIELDLTPIEFKILNLLASEVGRAFTRDEILDKVWGQNIYVFHRSVDTHVSKLRKKLLEHGHMIQSVHSLGYKIQAPEAGTQNKETAVS